MSDNIKKQLGAVIDSYKEDLCQMSDEIFDLAEISGEEYKTSDILCSYLEKEGFVVERGTGLETAFRATWDNGSDGPVIGILVEYDALEKIGHACGHHLQGPAGIGAAIAVKNCLQDYPCRLFTPWNVTTKFSSAIHFSSTDVLGEPCDINARSSSFI